jgi:hypothetical protein
MLCSVGAALSWQDESYDHLVRDDNEFWRIARYIENNPVTAGLAPTPEKYRWSSAWPPERPPQAEGLPHRFTQISPFV